MKVVLALVAALSAWPALAHGKHHDGDCNCHDAAAAPKDAPRSFAKKAEAGTWAKCAVSGEIFQVDGSTLWSQHEGRWYAFCCDHCQPDFQKEPARFADKK